jgi:hypothetical protein
MTISILECLLGLDQNRRVQASIKKIVIADDFLTENFLSTDLLARLMARCSRSTRKSANNGTKPRL